MFVFLYLIILGARCLALALKISFSNCLWFSFGSQNKSGFMLELRRRECTSSLKALNEFSSERLIFTNLGLCLTFFNMSKTDKYGKWSDRLDLITQDNKCCLGSFSLQNIWAISEALDLLDLVGTVILGNMSWVTNISKKFLKLRPFVYLEQVYVKVACNYNVWATLWHIWNNWGNFLTKLLDCFIIIVWMRRSV